MISPKRMARFVAKMLVVLLPLLGIVLALNLLTEVYYRGAKWADLGTSWRLWAVLARNIVPSIVALLLAYLLAARFAQALYKIDSPGKAQSFVRRCLFGLPSFGPWLKIAEGVIGGEEDHILVSVGGPGHLVVYNDTAVLLERSGQFTQVNSANFVPLKPFEKVYAAVDLRVKRWVYPVSALSKEGIPIICEADISYQIDSEDNQPTEQSPFPFSESNVFTAATCTWIREANRPLKTRTMNWEGRVIISETEGNLRTLLSQYPLDRLIGFPSLGSENARERIRTELETRLRGAVPKLGARIVKVELGDIKVRDQITQQWIEFWQAKWESWTMEQQALGKADQIEQWENAKTQAQAMMLKSITAAFEPLLASKQKITSRLVLTRLFMVLSRAQADPLTQVYLPQEAITTLKLLKELTT